MTLKTSSVEKSELETIWLTCFMIGEHISCYVIIVVVYGAAIKYQDIVTSLVVVNFAMETTC